jgi:hypothetical protein
MHIVNKINIKDNLISLGTFTIVYGCAYITTILFQINDFFNDARNSVFGTEFKYPIDKAFASSMLLFLVILVSIFLVHLYIKLHWYDHHVIKGHGYKTNFIDFILRLAITAIITLKIVTQVSHL